MDKCMSMLGMGISHPERKGTPQPKESFYLCPPRTTSATTGESPFFSMSAEPDTSKTSFGTPWNKHER